MLGQRAHWTSPLKSAIRYIVAAMIPRRGREPSLIRVGSSERLGAFKAHRIAKRGTGPTLAALLLPLHADGEPVPGRPLERLAQIHRSWRENRFWLTNADDLPAAVLHACREEAAEILTFDVERAYCGTPDSDQGTRYSSSRTCGRRTRQARMLAWSTAAASSTGSRVRASGLDRAVTLRLR